MGQIGGDTRGSNNVVQRKLCNVGGELEQQAQWLSDASVGAQDGNFLSHGGSGGVKTVVVFGSKAQDAAGSGRKHVGSLKQNLGLANETESDCLFVVRSGE